MKKIIGIFLILVLGTGILIYFNKEAIFGNKATIGPDTIKNLKYRCNEGNAKACSEYASKMEDAKKFKVAKEYYLKGCELKDGIGCFFYGTTMEREKNISEAKKYFIKACELKVGFGCMAHGWIMEEEKNMEEAIKYYKMACDLGYKEACL